MHSVMTHPPSEHLTRVKALAHAAMHQRSLQCNHMIRQLAKETCPTSLLDMKPAQV